MGFLLALARSVAVRGGPGLGRRLALTGGATAAGTGIASALFGGDDADRPRRRRRRPVLTASDRADIAFISGALGKPAGKDFAMIVAARVR